MLPRYSFSPTPASKMTKDFVEIELPQQKSCDGVLFPGVLSPNPSLHLSEFVECVKEEKALLESLLLSRGAILFRDFPVKTAEDFNQVVEAFGYEDYSYVGGFAPRIHVVGRVLTANESEQDIPFHHDMAHASECPTKIFFFCDEEPRKGGETPIVLSHLICERMIQKYPEFVEKLEQGVIYRRIIGQGDDPASAFGRGWQSTFSTTDKSIAEERAAGLGIKLEWMEDGVKLIMGPIPAIKVDKSRGRNIWFNQTVTVSHKGFKDVRNDLANAVTFGDGTLLPADIINDCQKIMEEESVAIPWKKGDILLIDNMAVLHSRRSFDPPRRVLASLCK